MSTSAETYAACMARVHADLGSHPAVRQLFDPHIDACVLHRFLIEYCALGVQLTAPVEGWIRRAGNRCKEIGLSALGDNLTKHAVHEAGHEALFVEDTKQLSARYTSRYGELIDPQALLDQAATPAMRRYIELHEETIAGPAPFAQVAIELEIEGLSVKLGPTLLKQLTQVLGASILECCSFLTEHVALDVGHTALNNKMLERLVAAKPEALPILVETGRRALEAYLGFLGECMDRALDHVAAADRGSRATA
jgi:heme oxygenase-like protein